MRRYRRVDRMGPARRAPPGPRGVSGFWSSRRTLPRFWLVVSILAGLMLAEMAVWVGFAIGPQPGATVMTDESCSRNGCHSRPADDAFIYVAVDGKEVLPNQPIPITVGDLFEVDFHFTGMAGDPERFGRVGMEIVVPDYPSWRVTAGTLAHPEEWFLSGLGANLWSATWDRATNGDGATLAEWVQSPDRPNAYYLSWARAVATVAIDSEFILRNTVSDRGVDGERDPDGIAGHAGADALITVPLEAEPGLHQVEISGIGHTPKGKLARVSATVVIAVTRPAGAATGAPPATERRVLGVEIYQELCTGCHGATPNTGLQQRLAAGETAIADAIRYGTPKMRPFASTEGGPLNEEEVQAVVQYLLDQLELSQVPGPSPIPHDVARAPDCLACHGGERTPEDHAGRDAGQCLSCHRQGPEWMKGPPMIHSPETQQDCRRCHVSSSAIGAPATHWGRTNETCLICHVSGPQMPPIPHAIPQQTICLTCHGPEGQAPVPPSHEDRGEDVCLACHRRSAALESGSP